MKKFLFLLLVGVVWLVLPFTVSIIFFPQVVTMGMSQGEGVAGVLLSQTLFLGFTSLVPAGLLALSGYAGVKTRDIALVVAPFVLVSVFKFISSDLKLELSTQLLILSISTRAVEIIVPLVAIGLWVFLIGRLLDLTGVWSSG